MIYEALDIRQHIRVIIKEIRPESLVLFPSQGAPALFQQNATLFSELEHSNVITVSDSFEKDEQFYLVIPFLWGRTLTEPIQEWPIPKEDSVTYS